MKFLFDSKDEVCLPMMWKLIGEIKPFLEKIKNVEFEDGTEKKSRKEILLKVAENILQTYPKETARILSKLWILEEKDFPILDVNGQPVCDADGNPKTERRMEEAPNVFVSLAALVSSETAINFFTSALPFLLRMSKDLFRQLT